MINRRIVIASIIGVVLGIYAIALQVSMAAPPPARAERVEDAVTDLNLNADQQQKADALMQELRDKERLARENFLKQMGDILSPEQLQQLKQKVDRPGNGPPHAASSQPVQINPANAPKGTVIFQGGYETDPRDHGRPVVLVAAGLNVPTDVFRTAFSGVTPAHNAEPEEAQVRKNKEALLKVLEPHGVTDDQINTVSNYYRYNGSHGEMWKTVPATATAVITNGVVTGITVTNAGAGYSSPPTVAVAGYDVHSVVTLNFGTDLSTNGSIKSITLSDAKKP